MEQDGFTCDKKHRFLWNHHSDPPHRHSMETLVFPMVPVGYNGTVHRFLRTLWCTPHTHRDFFSLRVLLNPPTPPTVGVLEPVIFILYIYIYTRIQRALRARFILAIHYILINAIGRLSPVLLLRIWAKQNTIYIYIIIVNPFT